MAAARSNVDVLVIGAGMVGAACAHYCAAAGLRVAVVDRGSVASGTTSGGEGNILVSDKEPGPELDLALLSISLWRRMIDGARFELQAKGGVVVARSAAAAIGLAKLAGHQRAAGVEAVDVRPSELAELEPNLTPGVVSGAYYPQDMQVQPMLAAAQLLRDVTVHAGAEVVGFLRGHGDRVTGVRLADGDTVSAGWVVNAAGTWGGEIAALAQAPVPVLPRRGFVLVTEPLPVVVRHKVYSADYVANVASGAEGLETSVVVEGTESGTVLIGASRERVGFDRTMSLPVLRRLAAQAVGLFPFLANVNLLRSYLGFRPYCPDHLPVIGPDPRAPGLVHACGHEGAGIGLAPATGQLIAQSITGVPTDLDLHPFRPDRFAAATADVAAASGRVAAASEAADAADAAVGAGDQVTEIAEGDQ